MKSLKNILKFSLLLLVTTVVFVVASALLPYSQDFRAAAEHADTSGLLALLLTNAWICFTIVYIVKHSAWGKRRLLIGLTASLFFVYSFMAQIETLFFGDAFPVLTYADIFLITIANGLIVFVGVPLGIKLFSKKQEKTDESTGISLAGSAGLIVPLSLIGLIYTVVYFVFGYYVAWQAEELRVFYSGQAEDNGFMATLLNNYTENPVIFPFQFLRGILFGVFVLPLVSMFKAHPKLLLRSLILVFLSPGISLMIPNFLFPDTVRWAHFTEMMSSMFIFAILVWFVFDQFERSKKASLTEKSKASLEVLSEGPRQAV